jgi:acyl-coenzyme A synthetase/AMP-(fatty) acid ligase
MAFVILRTPAAKNWRGRHHEFEKALKAYARTRLPGFASPEWIQVVDELPKTSTGKQVNDSGCRNLLNHQARQNPKDGIEEDCR